MSKSRQSKACVLARAEDAGVAARWGSHLSGQGEGLGSGQSDFPGASCPPVDPQELRLHPCAGQPGWSLQDGPMGSAQRLPGGQRQEGVWAELQCPYGALQKRECAGMGGQTGPQNRTGTREPAAGQRPSCHHGVVPGLFYGASIVMLLVLSLCWT